MSPTNWKVRGSIPVCASGCELVNEASCGKVLYNNWSIYHLLGMWQYMVLDILRWIKWSHTINRFKSNQKILNCFCREWEASVLYTINGKLLDHLGMYTVSFNGNGR